MMTVRFYYAWSLPPRVRRAVPLVVIIIMIVSGAALVGHSPAVLIGVGTAALATAVKELVRAGLRYKLRSARSSAWGAARRWRRTPRRGRTKKRKV